MLHTHSIGAQQLLVLSQHSDFFTTGFFVGLFLGAVALACVTAFFGRPLGLFGFVVFFSLIL